MTWLIGKLQNQFKLWLLSDIDGFLCVYVCVCVCVRGCAARCVCSQYTPEWHRVKRVGKWDKFPEAILIYSSMPLAFYLSSCLPPHLPTQKHTCKHMHTLTLRLTHSCEPIHPSPWHDCSSLVTLCSNPSVLSKNGNYTQPLMQPTDRVRIMAWCITANCY